MTFSSLPDYRDLSSAAQNQCEADVRRTLSDVICTTLFDLLLLAALWGLPYYLRSVVVADLHERQTLPHVQAEPLRG